MKTSVIRAALAALMLSGPAAAFANTASYSGAVGGPVELAYAHDAGARKADDAVYGQDRWGRGTGPQRSEDGSQHGHSSFIPRSDALTNWSGNDNQG
ncbi:hypothetical protein [Hansschlegelia zhihuaiae]|uniref:Uncharacterized protein n=1 Tax=Hansschlegelia zhihuaiae TaxID=405005 RepID=A0A4Q0MC28_9HYPH|nr:hypothetical protein [Hansschlegelia zhihuaiae]RXF70887.1 hypothetical protein EK403_15865 [Hansschlegelia zhihuaiae]